ncbi:MAG: heavy-metal-associated domain-containing protein [Thermomonas sp.]|uniref:heavy-metal-associated domain-containing protein n=1 Tax=Thermomonas sp. TaxID=1971895 RepID=UPI001EC4FFC4|nr:heavy-metal-associated domain-containing protein [Thermomonas sp.]MBV2209171.1 heavy-metal-associated domain-containing protein [Thermomonas sp.]
MLFKVENMSCQHCVNAITRALQALDKHADVTVDLSKGEVSAHGQFSAADVIAALQEEDYPATLIHAD